MRLKAMPGTNGNGTEPAARPINAITERRPGAGAMARLRSGETCVAWLIGSSILAPLLPLLRQSLAAADHDRQMAGIQGGRRIRGTSSTIGAPTSSESS